MQYKARGRSDRRRQRGRIVIGALFGFSYRDFILPKLQQSMVFLSALLAGAWAVPTAAAMVGSDASACLAGRSSVAVHLTGFKQPTGTVSIALYAQQGYLQKGAKLRKVEVPVRSLAPIDLCIAVPHAGRYAIAAHHDLNANGNKDRSDGGGYSRNPKLSIFNLKPGFGSTGIDVGNAPRSTTIVMMYAKGLSIGPVRG